MGSAKKDEGKMMGCFFVTGVAGFIGSHLAEALLTHGHQVVGIDNFHSFYSHDLKKKNLSEIEITAKQFGQNFTFFELDLRNQESMETLLAKYSPEGVYHLAALAGVRPSIENPVEYWDVNCKGSAILLQAMQKNSIKKLVFASSSSVYGNCKTAPFREDLFVGNPISPYAATKCAGELLCYNYSHLYSIHTACIRFFTVYGPRQRPDLAIHKFTRLLFEEKEIPFFGDGSSERDYTYVSDIVQGLMQAMIYVEHHPYDIFNLGESSTVSLARLVQLLEQFTGKSAKLKKLPFQPGDVERTWADISKAKAKLNYSPQVTKEEGLRKFVEWFKETNQI